MAGFGEKKEQPRRPLYDRPIAFLALAVALVAGLGISLYVNRSRSKALQQEVAGLRQRMQEIDNKAETARNRATEAEQSARQSALAKDQAETRRVEAEAEAKQASVVAEEAKQRAATAEQEKQAAVAEAERIAFLAIAGGAAVAGIVMAGGGGGGSSQTPPSPGPTATTITPGTPVFGAPQQ